MQTLDEKVNTCLQKKYLAMNISKEVAKKLEQMNDCEHNMFNSFLTKISKLESENKILTDLNKNLEIELTTKKSLLKTA